MQTLLMRPVFKLVLFVVAISASVFASCSNQQATRDSFGDIDTAKIASDTIMQANMDKSYEYQKTLRQNDSVVYDFLAYDRPKTSDAKIWEGKFIVIKRTNSSQDTIIKGNRSGPVKGLCLVDLDGDGQSDIFFYENNYPEKYKWLVRIYSPMQNGKYREISWRETDAKSAAGHYNGGDTFFVYQNHLIRRYPYYELNYTIMTKANLWQSYKLNKGKIVLENEKLVRP